MKYLCIFTMLLAYTGMATYAQTGAAVGFTNGTFDVSATGAATYAIPIACPVGIQGVQPNVALSYNSQGGNGVAGWGWGLAGISAIARTGSTFYHDGKAAGIAMADADNFTLDGQRLILVAGSHFTAGAKYRTEVETFSDITYKSLNGHMGFEVVTKEGKTLQYGASDDSYINAFASSTSITWLLTRVQDANGSYMTYTYGESNGNGEFWLNKIAYTGNSAAGVAPVNEITFEYESRTDVETRYVGRAKTTMSKRLKTITAKSNNQLFRRYTLSYTFDGLYSKLTGVQESTADGDSYTPLAIAWKDDEWDEYSKYGKEDLISFLTSPDDRPIFADFNGDGRRDFITIKDKVVKLYLSYSYYGMIDFSKKCEFTVYGDTYKDIFLADLNGDDFMDVVGVVKASDGTYRYNFYFFNGEEFTNGGTTGYYGFNEEPRDNNYIVGDFNGDGKQEILIKNSQKVYNQYGTQIGRGGITSWGTAVIPSFPNNMFLLNITGSGKTNVCTIDGGAGYIYELNNGAFQLVFSTTLLTNMYHMYPGDYNGDGKTDFLVVTNNHSGNYECESYLLLSTSSSFVRKNIANVPLTDPYSSSHSNIHFRGFSGDFNLDGKTDIMFAQLRNSGKYVFKVGINNGSGFTFRAYDSNYEPDLYNVFAVGLGFYDLDVADYDGDGRCEVGFNRYLNQWRIRSFSDSFFSRVATISNGLEAIDLSYKPIADRGIYSTSDGYAVSFPLSRALLPMHVVSSVYHNNQSTGYSYKNIRTHKQGKGFLGFGEVRKVNSTTGIKTTTEYGYHYYCCYVFIANEVMATTQDAAITTTTYTNSLRGLSGVRIYPYVSQQTTTDHLNGLSATTSVFGLDSYGNPTSVQTVRGDITETVTTAYVSNGSWCPHKPSSVTRERRQSAEVHTRTTQYEYDAKGNLTKETRDPQDVNKVVTEYKNFDAFGHARRVEVTANGSTSASTLSYTPSGRFVASRSNALGEATTYQWNEARGLLTSETDARGLTTSYLYDAFGRLRETTYPDGNKQAQDVVWIVSGAYAPSSSAKYYTYNQASDGAKRYVWFDNLGREICSQTFDLNGRRISVFTEYNSKGLKYRVSKPKLDADAMAWAETYTYDSYLRPTKIATPRGDAVYAYNGRTTTLTSPEGTRETLLNTAGQVATSKTNGQAVSYTYYASGLTKAATPDGGQAATMAYNLQGHRITLTDPNAGATTSTYNGLGQLLTQTDARGKTETLRYDKLGRVVERVTPEATYTYAYNAHGLESVKRGGVLEYAYRYDRYGRMAGKDIYVEGSPYSYSYTYNALGQLHTKSYPNGSLTLSYGYTNGRLKTMGSGSSTLWQLADENVYGQPLRYTWGNGQQTTLEYDAHGLLQAKSAGSRLPAQSYSFNPSTGNLNSRSYSSGTESFTYDALHRLTGWSNSLSATYAANGNIATKSDVGAYLYSSGRPHAMSGIADPVANIDAMVGQVQSIAYDYKNRPSYIAQGADSLTFYYDHTGQRLYAKRYKSGALYKTTHYVGEYEREVYADNTQRTRCFVRASTGLHAAYEADNGVSTLLYVHTDHLGSIVGITDANGNKLAEYSYDPWGRLRNPQTLQPFPFSSAPALRLGRGFTGHEHLPEFGLINMNARLYDPLVGRFLNPDPYVQMPDFSQNYNRYSYCLNNPLKYTDPSGELILAFLRSIVDAIKYKDFSKMDPTLKGTAMNNSLRIWGGLFEGNPRQIFSRFTWEAPQTIAGFLTAHFTNTFKDVYAVDYFDGATVLETSWEKGSFALGSYIELGNGHSIYENHLNPMTNKTELKLGATFMHEYGHYKQSQTVGPFYFIKYALPSLFTDNYTKPEQDANSRAYDYFSSNHSSEMPHYSKFIYNEKTKANEVIFVNWNDDKYPKGYNRFKWWEGIPIFWPFMSFWNY